MDFLGNLGGGFAIALTPWNLFFCRGGDGGDGHRSVARSRYAHDHCHVTAGDLQNAADFSGDHAGRYLLRSDVRRVHHFDPPEHPGEAASVVTCLDGYQMARQGRAGRPSAYPRWGRSSQGRSAFWDCLHCAVFGGTGVRVWICGIYLLGPAGLDDGRLPV